MLEAPTRTPAADGAAADPAPARGRAPYGAGLRYAPGLDGLRAIAVTGVLLYHARVPWAPGGFLGVDLFFVLSGYLITSLLLAEYRREGTIDLAAFWAGRVRRLLPAATVVVAVSVLIGALFLPGDFGRVRTDALSALLYVNNWHQVLAAHSYFASFGRPSLLQHYWSLGVEEQFYLVWPLVVIAGLTRLRRGRLVLVALAIAVASALLMALLYHPGADPSRVYYGTDTRAAPLMIGAIVAFVWPFMRMTAMPRAGAAAILDGVGLLGLLVVLYAMGHWHDYDPFLYRGGFVLAALAAVAAIATAAHPATRLGHALGSRPLRWLGQRSYGIYLWHWPIMALTRPGIDVHASTWIVIPAQAALAVILAALSYRYVEMPVRRRVPQQRIRAWLARQRPRRRLALVGGSAGAVALAIVAVGLAPASGSALPQRLQALEAKAPPPIPAGSAMQSAAGARPGPALGPGQSRALGAGRGTAAGAGRGTAAGALRSAGRPPPGPSRSSAPSKLAPVAHGPVLAVGASVMLAAEPELEHRLGARVDAVVGRQVGAIIDRLAAYRAAGALPPRVVVQIGDNGPVWWSDVERLRHVLAGVPEVVLINVREPASWQQEVNDELQQAVQGWPQARIADWYGASGDSSLLYDGAHPNPRGAALYAEVVARALARAG